MIPKILHFVWIGDESRRPDACIQTWRDRHLDFEVRVWGNTEWHEHPWVNARHMEAMAQQQIIGVVDLMRYEILAEYGGIALDADSLCVRCLDHRFLEPEAWACWENETVRPGLIAIGAMGCRPGAAFFEELVYRLNQAGSVAGGEAWQTTGPQAITDTYNAGAKLTVFPSHYFYPEHFEGVTYQGSGPIFARQLWASTVNSRVGRS